MPPTPLTSDLRDVEALLAARRWQSIVGSWRSELRRWIARSRAEARATRELDARPLGRVGRLALGKH